MIGKNSLSEYINKILKKWFIYLSFIPGLLGTMGFYFGFADLLLSWQISLYIFIITLTISSYFVWEEKKKENEELWNKLKEIEDKKPKLSLSFKGDKKTFLLKNKIFKRVLNERFMGIKSTNPNVIQRMIKSFHNPVIDEIHEAFIPLKFELHNEGNFKATDVNVDIYFPKDLVLIEELPQQQGFVNIGALISSNKRTYGRFFQKKNHLRLWCDKSQHPYYLVFKEVYIFANKKDKFKIKYEIHADELDSNGIKGELTIDAQPVTEVKEYSIKSELERDKLEYESFVESKLQETLE